MIFCHGLLGNKNNFASVGKHLHEQTGRTVYSIDMVNHGKARRSEKCSYEDMAIEISDSIDELCHGSAALIGHSMGGRAVMWEALNNPDKVSSLIVVDVAPGKGFTKQEHGSIEKYLQKMRSIQFPDVPKSEIRKWLDKELEEVIPVQGVRNFVMTNLHKEIDPKNDKVIYGWKCNVEALYKDINFLRNFPDTSSTYLKGARYELRWTNIISN